MLDGQDKGAPLLALGAAPLQVLRQDPVQPPVGLVLLARGQVLDEQLIDQTGHVGLGAARLRLLSLLQHRAGRQGLEVRADRRRVLVGQLLGLELDVLEEDQAAGGAAIVQDPDELPARRGSRVGMSREVVCAGAESGMTRGGSSIPVDGFEVAVGNLGVMGRRWDCEKRGWFGEVARVWVVDLEMGLREVFCDDG